MHMACFALWKSSSTHEDNSSCINKCNEDNEMHNEKWAFADDFMQNLSSQQMVVAKVVDDHKSLSVTTQKQQFKNESCKDLAKIKQPPIRTRLKIINSYASPPFVNNDQKGLKT